MGDNAGWARGMPWRLIGFGAAFISALLVWHVQRDIPQAMAGQLALGAHTALGAEDSVEPEAADPANATRSRPPVAAARATPNNQDVTLEINTSSTTIVEDSTLVVVPAEPPPPQIVVLVHQAAPQVVVPRARAVTGRGGGFFTPITPRRPPVVTPRPNVTRSIRQPPLAPRRPSAQRGGVGTPSTPRRTPIRQIPRR